jgi:hypothetical protein
MLRVTKAQMRDFVVGRGGGSTSTGASSGESGGSDAATTTMGSLNNNNNNNNGRSSLPSNAYTSAAAAASFSNANNSSGSNSNIPASSSSGGVERVVVRNPYSRHPRASAVPNGGLTNGNSNANGKQIQMNRISNATIDNKVQNAPNQSMQTLQTGGNRTIQQQNNSFTSPNPPRNSFNDNQGNTQHREQRGSAIPQRNQQQPQQQENGGQQQLHPTQSAPKNPYAYAPRPFHPTAASASNEGGRGENSSSSNTAVGNDVWENGVNQQLQDLQVQKNQQQFQHRQQQFLSSATPYALTGASPDNSQLPMPQRQTTRQPHQQQHQASYSTHYSSPSKPTSLNADSSASINASAFDPTNRNMSTAAQSWSKIFAQSQQQQANQQNERQQSSRGGGGRGSSSGVGGGGGRSSIGSYSSPGRKNVMSLGMKE